MLAAAHPYEQSRGKKLLVEAIEGAKRAIVAEQHEQQEFAREMGVTVQRAEDRGPCRERNGHHALNRL
jgi:hypothetical protein